MTDIELMKQALEKLEFLAHMKSVSEDTRRLITALQERLARQEQKPVAWRAHVEQRLLTWRQAFANRSGRSCVFSLLDRRSLDDLIDFVCDEYTAPREHAEGEEHMSMCPSCGTWSSKTLETRKDTRFNWKWRRRTCNDCGHTFETYEINSALINPATPVNPNGKLERR